MKKTLLSFISFSFIIASHAQHSPQQPWKGKTGNTLKESTPYKIEYNKKATPGSPNIVWILIDDAGFGATTTFGGLVETPNIEKLANQGLRFSNFHTTAICSPTRAALLTGRNSHSAHVGLLTPAAIDFPGYDAHIPFEKATAAEILRENGYNTFALGKWHLTPVLENTFSGPFNRWPTGRGFDHFYGFHPGATDQWNPELWEDQTKLNIEGNKKHLNTLLADKAIQYIANQKSSEAEKPFFLYLAPGATHSPIQVAKEWVEPYKGKFDQGWDKYRELVIERQKKLGIIPVNAVLPERNPGIKAWETLTDKEKKAYAKLMEVYAGFYTFTDYEIGRVVNYLEQIDELDNTLIVLILGDNGASKGGGEHGAVIGSERLKGDAKLDAILNADVETEIHDYPTGWAAAANTPFRLWKTDANTEGGTRNPLIIYYPQKIKEKGVRNQYGHVNDVLPTTLEIVNAQVPAVINGYKQEPLEGTSLVYAFGNEKAPSKHTVQYFEIAGTRAIYKDGWKAGVNHKIDEKFGVSGPSTSDGIAPDGSKADFSKDVWELYNLNEDFNERNNLAEKNPEKLKELQAAFDTEAKKYNVYPLKDFTAHDMPAGRTVYGKSKTVTLFPGVDHLSGVNSPLYDGRTFTVTAETELVTGKEEGVLFAVGGEKTGISLFLKDGKLQLAHRTNAGIQHLESTGSIPAGKVRFRFEYKFTGPKENEENVGSETLFVNDLKVGEKSILKGQATIGSGNRTEGTDIGRDLRNPVSDRYAVPFAFTGKLKKVTIQY